MRRSIRSFFAALVLSLVVVMPASVPVAGQSDAPTGTISIGFESDIQYLDPALAYDVVSIPLVRTVFNQLLQYETGTTTLVPGLAVEMPQVSDDGLVYTFKLREGVPFVRKGEVVRDVTADDVVFSLNRLLRPDLLPAPSPVGGAFFGVIAGADEVLAGTAETASGLEAIDPLTVQITLSRPDRTLLNALAMTFGSIIPAESGYDGAAFGADPVGTGPFWLESYTPGEVAVFQHNPHYFVEGLPNAASIEARLLVPADLQLRQAQANELDIMGNDIPAADWNTVTGDPRFADRVIIDPIVATNYLSMDTTGPDSPFTDVLVRQAVNHVIDKANLVRIMNGRAETAGCILPPRIPGHDAECAPYAYDIEKAKALMAQAGVSGFSTQLYTDTTDLSVALAESIAADLAQIGIEAEVVAQDFDTLLGTITTPHAAPLVYIGWFQDFPDPSDFIDPILSCAAAVEGGANVAWYCNEEADALAAEARTVIDIDAAIPAYQDIQDLIMADAPWAPVTHPSYSSLRSERLQGYEHMDPVWFYTLETYSVAE